MAKRAYNWEDWGRRFVKAAKDNGFSLKRLGTMAGRIGVESTIRSYTNKTRDITLKDFFKLCEQASVDPHDVLFGRFAMTREDAKEIAEAVTLTLDSRSGPRKIDAGR